MNFSDIEISEGSIIFNIVGRTMSTSKLKGIDFLVQSLFDGQEKNEFKS
jgi:hypothetical protein